VPRKASVYRVCVIAYLLLYFLCSLSFVEGARTTYYSLLYVYLNWGFDFSVYNYLRVACYLLLFMNGFITVIIMISAILSKNINLLSILFCAIHGLICVLYYLAYYNVLFNLIASGIAITPLILYVFLWKKYVRYCRVTQ